MNIGQNNLDAACRLGYNGKVSESRFCLRIYQGAEYG